MTDEGLSFHAMRQADRDVPPRLEDELAAHAARRTALDRARARRLTVIEARLTAVFWLAVANLLATLALWWTH
jgi:hypothetical protein